LRGPEISPPPGFWAVRHHESVSGGLFGPGSGVLPAGPGRDCLGPAAPGPARYEVDRKRGFRMLGLVNPWAAPPCSIYSGGRRSEGNRRSLIRAFEPS